MEHLTPDNIQKYINKLYERGESAHTIQKKLTSLQKFAFWAKDKGYISTTNFKQLRTLIAKHLQQFPPQFEAEDIAGPQNLQVPPISDFEQAQYHGEKVTDGVFGEVNVRFHLQTYKIKSWLNGILRRAPLIGHFIRPQANNELETPKSVQSIPSTSDQFRYVSMALVLLLFFIIGAGVYRQFFKNVATPFAYPSTAVRGSRTLNFQGRVTDSLGNPITTATNMVFKLYDAASAGNQLYTSGTCSITPDQDGVANVLIGSTCGSEIANTVFTENTNVYLGVTVGADSEATPRQSIANVGYAINSETLQGLPPGSAASNIPFISSGGEIKLSASTPTIHSSFASETFKITSAKAITLQSAGTGNITLDATGSGELVFKTAGAQVGVFDTSGNFGIGDTTPTALLTVGNGDLFKVTSGGAISAATGIASSGTITFSGLSTAGVVINNSSGVLSTDTALDVANGGTNIASYTTGDILYASGATTLAKLGVGASGTVLHGGTTPSYSAVSLTSDVSGTLPIANGGTAGTATPTAGAVAYGTGSAYAFSAAGSSGECLKSGAAGSPTWAACTAGGTVPWSSLTDPTGNLSLSHGTNTTTMTTAATTGTFFTYTGTAFTTGELLDLTSTHAPSDGSTNEAIDINITHSPTTSADNFQSINLTTTDGTALGNTVYGIQNTLTFTGNAAKTGIGSFNILNSSSTTADTLVVFNAIPQVTGAISTGTRNIYGYSASSGSTAANTGGTDNLYGIYSIPSSTLAAGSTENVYGGYFKAQGTVASGTINTYGLYVANPTMNTTGTSAKYGLYVEDVTAGAADTNYAAIFAGGNVGIGDTTPAAALTIGSGDLFQVNSSGAIAAATGITSSGTITFSGFSSNGGPLYTNGSGVLAQTTAGTSTQVLHGGTSPSFSAVSLTSDVSGTLPIANGGTAGTATPTAGAVAYGTGSAYAFSAAGSSGECLKSGAAGSPTWAACTAGGTVPISSLTAAAATNSIANADYQQTWNWDTLSGTGLSLASASTAAAGNAQKLLSVAVSGANGTSTQTTYGTYVTNTHTGTASTNVAGYFSASGGTNNYAAIFAAGNVGIGDTTPAALFTVGSGDLFQVNSSGVIAAATGITSSGTITFSGFSSNGGPLYTNGSGVLAQTTAGTSTQILHGGTSPSFSAVSLTADVSGTLPIANGGTNGTATPTAGAVAYGTGSAYAFSLAGSSGECLKSGATGSPTWAACTAGGTVPWSSLTDPTGNLSLSHGTNTTTMTTAATTGTFFTYTGTAFTTGELLDLTSTHAPSDGSTNEAIDINITHTPTSSADSFQSINLTTTDGTALGNTVYGIQNTLTFTGNAAKTGIGSLNIISSSSTTADTIVGFGAVPQVTGAISTGTRNIYGYTASSGSTAANTGGTDNLYGIYSIPSSTLAAGSTENVYGGYFKAQGTVASGTINTYGLYVANPTMNTTGTSAKYGLYVEDVTAGAADTNYAAIFAGGNVGIGDTTPDALLDLDSTTTTGNMFGLLNTSFTTGEIADITGTWAPSDASTNEAIDINITHTPTSSADNFQSINLTTTDGTALGNTVYGIQNTLTLTGNAGKTGYGIYSTVTSNSTTADTTYGFNSLVDLSGNSAHTGYGIYAKAQSSSTTVAQNIYGGYFTTNMTGALASNAQRNTYGVYSAPTNTAISTQGIDTTFGISSNPSYTASSNTDGLAAVVAGVYTSTTNTLNSGTTGTAIQYGIYIDNGTSSTNGSSTKYGLYVNAQSGADNNYMIYMGGAPSTANTAGLCWDNSGESAIYDCNGAPTDLAENFGTSDSSIEAGDIVVATGNAQETIVNGASASKAFMTKSTSPYQGEILGAISTSPNQVYGEDGLFDTSENPRPVSLAGRVPVKVSMENGEIKTGDYITSSSTPGVGMKATRAGQVIGIALSGTDSDGKIIVFIKPQYWSPNIADSSPLQLNDSGDVNIATPNHEEAKSTILSQNYNLQDSVGNLITTVGNFAQIVSAKVSTSLIETTNAVVNNVLTARIIIGEQIRGQIITAQTITTDTISGISGSFTNLTASEKIISPIVETDTLTANQVTSQNITSNNVQTDTIEAKNKDITVDLSKNNPSTSSGQVGPLAKLIIKGLADSPVATIDASGNASFSGELAAKKVKSETLETTGAATIGGDLTANRVNAGNITELENKTASLTTDSTQLSQSVNEIQAQLASFQNQQIPNAQYYQNLGANAVPLYGYIDENQNFIVQNQGTIAINNLAVSGTTNMYDAYVTHGFGAGNIMITSNEISSLTSELKLNALSEINLLDGAVVVARDGTLTTRGEVIAKGGVRTNKLQALNDSDNIDVKLSTASGTPSKFNFKDQTGTDVASIDASGSAQFGSIGIKNKYLDGASDSAVIAAADNLSLNGINAPAIQTSAQTAGFGTLPAGESHVIIYNSGIHADSLVYLTPTTQIQSGQLTVVKKEACTSGATSSCKPYFDVSIGSTNHPSIKFDWLIVN